MAVPETLGVHWKTRSPVCAVGAQLPVKSLRPPVLPSTVPPPDGTTFGLEQWSASVLVVVELVVLVVVELLVVELVVDVELVVVVELLLVLVVVRLVLVVELVVGATVVDVV